MATVTPKKVVSTARTSVTKKVPVQKVAAASTVKKTVGVKTVPKADAVVTPPAKKTSTAKSLPQVEEKLKKPKLVRDSFTMPEAEYAVLGHVKKACLKAGIDVKKSQLLRIGLVLLNNTDIPNLRKLINDLSPLKAGRPKKEK
ncbi:hypothetical protein KDM87_13080 [Undibacterium sp. FT147W]|uniref:Uncharacterized protein n=1 Tax=Undibacterium rivi TaxID=2828729 RepID=A0ABS5H3Z9_9BURK|nr:hypothetical protein [Undibacterium rivi]MBR7793533.1 hypothetical protein [Undibacterium rivi]